jgi:prepilin peptidase CpaA
MHSFAWWPTIAVLIVATFTDLRSRRIPNWLVLPFMAAGLIVPGWLHGWHGLAQSLEGFALGAVIYGFLSLIGGMGMGDVKLVAAIGAWIGPEQLAIALLLIAMAGGIMALGWAIAGGFKGEVWKSRKIPYAPAIAIGTMLSFFSLKGQ